MVPATSSHGFRDLLRDRLRSSRLDLPLLPDSASQILALSTDEEADLDRVAAIVQLDPTLAANVLHVANSAVYAPRTPLVTLSQAVTRLGLRTLCEVALSVALRGRLFTGGGRMALVAALWSHSASAALWAREIARQRRRNVECAFLAGLLHDVGKPVVLEAALELARTLGTEPTDDELVGWMDDLHEEVGSRLLEAWRLPDWAVAAARHHHAPEGAAEHGEVVRTVSLGDLVAHWSEEGDEEHGRVLAGHPVLGELGIYGEDLAELFARRDAVLEGVRVLL